MGVRREYTTEHAHAGAHANSPMVTPMHMQEISLNRFAFKKGEETFWVDDHGQFESRWGMMPAVLHQFDRDPDLDRVLTAQYLGENMSTFEIIKEHIKGG